MRDNIRKVALPAALAGLLIAAMAAPLPAQAASGVAASDFSAAPKQEQKKKQKKARPRGAPPAAYAPPPPYRRYGPADPSFDQYGRPYQPPPWIDCPVDLGYGRWGSCNTFN